MFVSSNQQIANLTATPNHQASIDDLLETDPRIIIRKLLRALPDETDAPALAVSSPSILKADEIDYNGDSDVNSKDELIDAIFGDETPTPYFVPCSGNRPSDVINAVQTPTSTPSSSGSSQISIDGGYDGDDDFDAIDELADSIFGSVTPTRYFFPAPQEGNNTADKETDVMSSPRPFSLPDMTCRSRNLSSSSSESESEQKARKFASTTNGDDDLGVIPLHFEPISDHSNDDEIVDEAESLMSDYPSRSSIDKEESGESETDTVSVDTLKETAIALSKVMSDLEVIEIHNSVNVENEFSVSLMEVRPWALPTAPTLFAYKGCDQITVPLEMECNQYAARIIREMAEAGNLVPIPSEQPASSLNKVGLLLDGDAFTSSSEAGNDSEFQSCDEDELMALITPSRGRKRGRDDDTDFEGIDNDTEDAMRTPSNSRQPRKRRKL